MKSIAVIIGFIPTVLCAQFSPDYDEYKGKYPDKDMIYLQRTLEVRIELEDDELRVSSSNSYESLFLTNRAHLFTEDDISYSTFFEIDNIQASSLNFEKGKYREKKVKDFTHKDDLSGYAFHDDSRKINFRYSSLQEGAKTRLSYDEYIKNPRFLPGFFFGGYYPSVQSKYIVIVDKSIELKFFTFNLEGYNVKQTREEKGGKVIFTWTCDTPPTYKIESSAVNPRFFLPQVFPVILNFTSGTEVKSILGSPEDLYKWYQELVSNINKTESTPEMVALVNELVADKETDLEKVKSIYYWTQKNIKYVAYEYGLGGFIPREANDIFEKKFGDCKDNSSIMKEMLEIAGIQSHLTWIGTRDIPYSYREFPTPAVDNHMILTYIEGEDHYFLDATGRFLSLDMPSSFIQGKEALIGLDTENFKIYKVPVVNSDSNAFIGESTIKVVGGDLVGSAHAIVKGYLKQDYFHGLEVNESPDRKKSFYRQNLRKGNNKFEISNLQETNLYSYDKDLELTYDFVIKDYIIQNENEYYINLNLSQQVADQKLDDEDVINKQMDYAHCGIYQTTLFIPDGYKVKYLPPKLEINEDLWEATIQYAQEDNKIIYSYNLRMKFINLDSEHFSDFNDFIKQIERTFKESVVLTK
ncbi:MAG: transglutaminase-like putative cysteine protease [Crocinitomicaceae bacterium]|jgi:transglutaminase-like putative cysteine protease